MSPFPPRDSLVGSPARDVAIAWGLGSRAPASPRLPGCVRRAPGAPSRRLAAAGGRPGFVPRRCEPGTVPAARAPPGPTRTRGSAGTSRRAGGIGGPCRGSFHSVFPRGRGDGAIRLFINFGRGGGAGGGNTVWPGRCLGFLACVWSGRGDVFRVSVRLWSALVCLSESRRVSGCLWI